MNKNRKLTKEDILKILKQNKEIIKKYGVKKIGIFGSYVRGEQKENSDVDLIVEFDSNAFGKDFEGLFDAFMDLAFYLEHLFGRKVDILTPEGIRSIRIKKVAENIEKGALYV